MVKVTTEMVEYWVGENNYKESIKIIALYDIHQKEIEIEILKIQLKGLN